MMNHKGYSPLGYITKTRGLKGEVQLFFEVEHTELYTELESVFVEINKKLVPFFIDSISVQNSVAYIFFEDVDHIDKASALVKKTIYISDKDKPEIPEKTGPEQYLNYFIIDKHLGEIGLINEVIKMPKQFLASVMYEQREALIPLADDFIISADHEKKEILMDLPEGLLDIYN